MKKKQVIAIIIVCAILLATGLVGVNSAIALNRLSEKTSRKNMSLFMGNSDEQITLPKEDYLGQIDIVGTIQETESITTGAVSEEQYRHSFYLKYIEKMEKDAHNKGIFLYVNSPGGTVYASDELYLRLMEYKEKTGRPIYAYFASEACSGAYYISMAADKIYANRNCWTGSIGVIISLMNYEELMKKIGITSVDITSGKNKTIGSAAHEMTKEQEQILQSLVDEAYDQFTGIVAKGRNMDIKTVKKLADGRIYSALQAKDQGLIDEIMGLEESKEAIGQAVGNKNISFYTPKNKTNWRMMFGDVFSLAGRLGKQSDIQAYRDLIEEDESGVLMYYAR